MKTLAVIMFLLISGFVFGLDPKFDLLQIDQTAFVNDSNNDLQDGRVSSTDTFLYYANEIKATISAEKKNPESIYVFFEKGLNSNADLTSYLDEVFDYYYQQASAVFTEMDYSNGEIEGNYSFYFPDKDSVVIYTKMNNKTGLRGFGVTRIEKKNSPDEIATLISNRTKIAVLTNKIRVDEIRNDAVYFKDGLIDSTSFEIDFNKLALNSLGNGSMGYLYFGRLLRINPSSDGKYRLKLHAAVTDPSALADPLLNSIIVRIPGATDLTVYDIISSQQSTFTLTSELQLTSISLVAFLTGEQFENTVGKLVISVDPVQ